MRAASFLLWVTSAFAAADQPPVPSDPHYAAVTGVAAGDVLNIRSGPGIDHAVVGTLAPGAAPVEVTGERGGWARLVAGEGNGWVAARFLTLVPVPRLGDTLRGLPLGLVCAGTEPFWAIELEVDGARLSRPDAGETEFSVAAAAPVRGRPDIETVWFAGPDGLPATLIVRRQYCSDGMSDRTYGYAATFARESLARPEAFAGCCRLPLPID
ncbi:MAG: COG3650 family protein [Paracoccaceae bacterium]